VLGGRLAAGQRLPATRRLAHDLDVGRITVLAAYDLLAADGFIASRSGSGAFVAASPRKASPTPQLVMQSESASTPMASRLSARGRVIVGAVYEPERLEPKLYTVGVPALDLFPREEWTRLVGRAWRRGGQPLLALVEAKGLLRLRQAIAAHLGALRGLSVDPARIFILNSTRQAIDLCARVLTDPGDRVWIEDPGFVGARAPLLAAGLELVPVDVDDEGVDVAMAEATAPDARLAYVTPAHQYPMGATLSLARRLELIDWARRTDSWLLEDDYDGEFRHEGPPVLPLQALDPDGQVLHVASFAKSLFPSLRLAFVVVPSSLIDAFAAARVVLDGHPPAAIQAALSEFLESGRYAAHLRRMRAAYAERRGALAQALKAQLVGTIAEAGSPAGMHFTVGLTPSIDDRALVARLVPLGISPCALSDSRIRPGPPGLILGFGAWTPEALARGVETLALEIARAAT
jgi:GntR family transcriptional regulator/MocR family aminotransferase